MKKLTLAVSAAKIPCPIPPALLRGARVGAGQVFNLFLLALLPVMFGFPSGCSALPQKKELPPQAQYLNEPPPPPIPVAPAPVVKTAPAPTYTGGGSVSDTRLADLASQFEALRARLQVVEGKLAEQENQLNQLSRSGNPEQRGLRDQLTALQRDLAATQERLARLESGRAPSSTPALRPCPAVHSGNSSSPGRRQNRRRPFSGWPGFV